MAYVPSLDKLNLRAPVTVFSVGVPPNGVYVYLNTSFALSSCGSCAESMVNAKSGVPVTCFSSPFLIAVPPIVALITGAV